MSYAVPVGYGFDEDTGATVVVYNNGTSKTLLPVPNEGGFEPVGTKEISITENGTYVENVKDYVNAEISVNVSGAVGYTAAEIANGTAPSGAVVVDLGTGDLSQYAFAGRTSITSVNVSCSNINISAMENCTGLVTAVIKKTASSRAGNNFLKGCTRLKTVDFAYFNGQIGQNTFQNDSSFDTLIIRNTDHIAELWGGVGTFNGTPFASNGTGGTMYVPSAMISAYQSASNWSTILGYANNSIQAIEGSPYENAYADGTPI